MEVTCPYCYESFDLDDYSESFRNEDDQSILECENIDCNKKFMGTLSISYSIIEDQADCLNNGKHNWHDRIVAPKHYGVGRQSCLDCGKERELPDMRIELTTDQARSAIYDNFIVVNDHSYTLVKVNHAENNNILEYASDGTSWYIFERDDKKLYRISYSSKMMGFNDNQYEAEFLYEGSDMLRVVDEDGKFSYAKNDIDGEPDEN